MDKKQSIIKEIARRNEDEFGPGGMLERSLETIVEEIYKKTAHFIYELIQNAEDNNYDCQTPTLSFTLGDGWLKVENNEKGFSKEDAEGISNIRESKKTEITLGYIGHKGIGFKAVFRVSDSPEIYSNGFHFRFNKTTHYVVPEWISTVRNGIDLQKTTIFLPFRKETPGEEPPEDITREELLILDPSIFLFLKKILLIKYQDLVKGEKWTVQKNLKPGFEDWLLMEGAKRGQWRLGRQILGGKGNPELPVDASKKDVTCREVVVAIPIDSEGAPTGEFPEKQVFAFLPTEIEANLRFIIQADFLVPADRENIYENRMWNKVMRDRAADAFVNGLKNWIKHEPFAQSVLRTIPHPNEISYSFFESLYDQLIKLLKEVSFLKSVSEKFLKPKEIIWTKSDEFRELFPNENLPELLGEEKVEYLRPDVEVEEHEELLVDLGTREFSTSMLISFLSKKDWVIKHDDIWFHKIFKILANKRQEISDMANLSIIPLENEQLATTDENPILPPRRKGGVTAFGLGPLSLNYVRWTLVREIPTRRTESEKQEYERNTYNRRFLRNTLGIPEDNPTDIIIDRIIPYFEEQTEGYNGPDTTFELVRYLKDRISEISLAFEKEDAQVGRYGSLNELLLDIWRIVPFRAIRISDGSNIGPLFGYELYLEPDSNRSLMEILSYIPGSAKVDIDYYVRKEKELGDRVTEEKAKQEWLNFFKAIGIHTVIRFGLLDDDQVSQDILKSLGLTTAGRNHKFKDDICSEDLETIIEKIIEEQNIELSRKLFHYLNLNFDELVSLFKKIKGEKWNFCLHTFRYYNYSPEEVLIEMGRLIRKKQWVVTKKGILGVPENLFIISKEEVEIVPDEKLIDFPRNALKPSFKEFLGLQEKVDVMDVMSCLKEIKSSPPQNISIRSGKLYRLLESGLTDSQEKLDEVKKEFEEGLIWLDSEWYSPNEMVWEGTGLGEWEIFPSIGSKYPFKKLFVEFLGIPEKVNFERINQGLKQLVLSGFKDTIKYTKLYYAYECLISKGTIEAKKDEQLSKGPFWLATDGKFYHIDELIVADTRNLYDSIGIFSKGKKALKILALPPAKQLDPSRLSKFYDYWGFERLSGAEQIFEFSGRKPIREPYDCLLSIGRVLAAKIRWDSLENYQIAIKNSIIPNLIGMPPVGVECLSAFYGFKGRIYRDSKLWHAAYCKGEIIVNTGLSFDPDSIARDLAMTLKIPQLEDFIARVLLEPSQNIDSLLVKKGITLLSDKEVKSLRSMVKIQPSVPVVTPRKPFGKKLEEEEETQKLGPPEVKGKIFGGITSYSAPSGFNQMLVDKFRGLYGDNEFLQSIERRKPDEVYFEEAEKEIVEAPAFLRIVLRRVNLDQGFLWAKRPGEQKFWGQELEEITLFGTDPSYKVTLCWNPQGDILHNKNELPLFFAKLGLVPGTVIEICTKPKLGEFVLRSIKEETIIENSKYIEFSEAGEPIWKVTPKLKFPFLVREDIYREDRRFEEWDALRELRKQDPRGAASMVFDTLKESDEPIDTGKIWNEVFRKFPYAKATVELILRNWPCFSCNEEGKWKIMSPEVLEPTQGFKDIVAPEEKIEVDITTIPEEEKETQITFPPSRESLLVFTLQEIQEFVNEMIKVVNESGSINYEKLIGLFKKLVNSKRRILGRKKVKRYEESTNIINSIIKNPNDKNVLDKLKNIIDVELNDVKKQPENLSPFPILEEISRRIPQKIFHQEIWPYVKNNIDMWVTELNLKEAKAKISCFLLIFERDSKSKEKINKKVKRIDELQEILNIGDLSTRIERLEKFPIEAWAKKYLEDTSHTFNSNLFNESKKYFEAGDIYKSGETIVCIDLNFEHNDSKNEIIEFTMKIAKALYELYFNTESPNKYRILKMAAQCYAFGGDHLEKKILTDFIDVYLFLSDEAWDSGDESRTLIYAKLARHLSLQYGPDAVKEAEEKIDRILKSYNQSAWEEYIKSTNKAKIFKRHKASEKGQKALDELMNKINGLKKDCEFQEPWQKKVIEDLLNKSLY